MRNKLYNISLIGSLSFCLWLGIILPSYGQIDVRFEQLGKATYKEDGKRTDGSASPTVTNVEAFVPLSHTLNEDEKLQSAWIGLFRSKFLALHTNKIDFETSPSEVFNLDLGIVRMKRIKSNQMVFLGVVLSMYSSHVNLFEFRSRNIFYSLVGAHIWEINPQLQLGVGGVVTMLFGYPLPVPFPYVKWKWGDRYMFDVQFISSPKVRISIMASQKVVLGLEYNIRGATALETVEGKKKMLNHTYKLATVVGTYKYKMFDIYSHVGVNFGRKMKFRDRKLKSYFRQNDTNFDPSFYMSVGVKYNLY